jgi:hypothetical protein
MRVMIFGSRSLTWKHLPIVRLVAVHAAMAQPPDLGDWLRSARGVPKLVEWLPDTEPVILLHGDGPPGGVPGAIGCDKLAELACMEAWPARRSLRRFPVEQRAGETWGQAAARRNGAMVAARPHRVYVVHTDLDSSKGSSMTAGFLTAAGIPYAYVRCKQSGELVGVEQR